MTTLNSTYTTNLEHAWAVDEGSGDLTDLQASLDLALTGTTWSPPGVYVASGNRATSGSGMSHFSTITFMIWVRRDVISQSNQALGVHVTNNGDAGDFYLEFRSDNKLHIDIPFVAANVYTGTTALTDRSKIHQIVMVRTGSSGSWTYKCYIDGVLDTTTTTASNPNTTSYKMNIGNFPSNSWGLQGNITGAAIWSRALSGTEIAELVKSTVLFIPPTKTYKRTVTIDHTKVPSDQTDFPIVVVGTLAELKTIGNGGHVQSGSGYDIAFYTDSDLQDKLDFERVNWSASTGAFEFWIRIPSLSSSTDTVIYLGYGSTEITADPTNQYGVWASGFVAVYHLKDGSTLSGNDSTANALNGTVDTGATATTGQIDGGGDFTGNSDSKITVATNSAFNVSNITVSCLMKTSDSSGADRNMVDRDDAGSNRVFQFRKSSAHKLNFIPFVSGANSITGGTTINTGSWFHVAGTYDGSNVRIYVNGASDATAVSVSGSMPSKTLGLKIGAFFGGSQFFIGQIDEVRIVDTARSADWLLAEYRNWSDPGTFYSVGSEIGPPPSGLAWLYDQGDGFTQRTLPRFVEEFQEFGLPFSQPPTATLLTASTRFLDLEDYTHRINRKLTDYGFIFFHGHSLIPAVYNQFFLEIQERPRSARVNPFLSGDFGFVSVPSGHGASAHVSGSSADIVIRRDHGAFVNRRQLKRFIF